MTQPRVYESEIDAALATATGPDAVVLAAAVTQLRGELSQALADSNRTTVRIGKPPRLSRRKRLARVLNQSARYLLALGLVFGGAGWLPSTTPQVFWLGVFLAAAVANPWRPKSAVRLAQRGVLRAAVHSGSALRGAFAGLRSGSVPPT